MEFVDQAALSPPEGYKDGGLQQALGGVLGNHIFGAQHIQQLQVIQRLQAKRAAMLAAQRTTNNNGTNQSGSSKNNNAPPPPPAQTICSECAECSECAAKQESEEGKWLPLSWANIDNSQAKSMSIYIFIQTDKWSCQYQKNLLKNVSLSRPRQQYRA